VGSPNFQDLSTKEVIRFNELKKTLSGISGTVLAERLLEMEREDLVTKKIYREIPPKVEYALTIRAKELKVILKELGQSLEIRRYVKDHDNDCGAEKTILKSPQVVLERMLIMIMNFGRMSDSR
jgi:DNA-binding HxlR family transcriptional regulator